MLKRGRILDGNNVAARSLVPLLPHEQARAAPTWLERLPPPQPRDPFAPPAAAPPPEPTADDWAQLEAERQKLAAERQQLQATQAQWMQALTRLAAQAAPQMPPAQLVLDVAMAVAREVVGYELATNTALVLRTIDDLLQAMRGEQQLELRLSPADFDHVQRLKPELAEEVHLVADPTLGPGGCVVETPRQVIDGSIDRRMAAVRAALHELPTANDNGIAAPASGRAAGGNQ